MCDIATQQSFVSQTHLPIQEPAQVQPPQNPLDPGQQNLERHRHDRVDGARTPQLARPQVRTGVEGAFVANRTESITAPSILRDVPSRPVERAGAAPVTTDAVVEQPKNFWDRVKDFMAKALEVIGDVISTVLGWLAKIGAIAGSLTGIVGRVLPGVGEFLGGVSRLSSLGGNAGASSSERPESVNAVRPRPRPGS